MPKYKVCNGLNLPNGARFEEGDVIDQDIVPPADRRWLREQGHIELIEEEAEEAEPQTTANKEAGKRSSRKSGKES